MIFSFEPTAKFDTITTGNINDRYICFQALSDSPTKKWHIIPANFLGEFYFSERHKYENGLSACIVAKNTKSLATTVISISDSSENCPYRLENRSNSMTIVFAQDDKNGNPIVLPPMSWMGYAFGNPAGKKKIRCVVSANTLSYDFQESMRKKKERKRLKEKRETSTLRGSSMERASLSSRNNEESSTGGRERKYNHEVKKEIEKYRKLLRGGYSRSYCPDKIGPRKDLPSPGFGNSAYVNTLSAEVRIQGGSKVLSFNDTEFHTEQQMSGDLGKKSQWQSIGVDVRVEGITLHLVDEEPKETLSLMLRDFRVFKRQREIDLTFRLRSLQIDNMLEDAFYPIVLRPVDMTYDPRTEHAPDNEPETYLKRRLHQQNENSNGLSDAEREVRLRSLTVGGSRRRSEANDGIVGAGGRGGGIGSAALLNKASGEKMSSIGSEGVAGVSNASAGSRKGSQQRQQRQQQSEEEESWWEAHDQLPFPIFETVVRYLPLSQLLWIPICRLHLSSLKLQVDLDFLLKIYELIQQALPDESEGVSGRAIEEAYEVVERKIDVPSAKVSDSGKGGGGKDGQAKDSRTSYVEKLTIDATSLEIELNLKHRRSEQGGAGKKSDAKSGASGGNTSGVDNNHKYKNKDEGGSDDGDEEDWGNNDNLSTLNSMGRNTNSGVSAALLTWVQNIASNFAHVSPIFTFDEFEERNFFGKTEDLLVKIGNIYKTKLIMQSLKVFGSMSLLGDPFRLFNSVTSGTTAFFTITRDEILRGGKDGVGGGVMSLVQGVVGGTFSSTAKITGNVANVISEFSGKGTALTLHAGNKKGPKHLGDGLMSGGVFFTTTMFRGVGGIVLNPIKGLGKMNPAVGFVSGLGSGVVGALTSPFVATFGMTSKVAESIDATTHMFDNLVLETRCRPRRVIKWGRRMDLIHVPVVKAIGIRIHKIVFQVNAGEHTLRGEKKRKVVIKTIPNKKIYKTKSRRPEPSGGHSSTSEEYSCVYEQTVVARSADLQMSDIFTFEIAEKGDIDGVGQKVRPRLELKVSHMWKEIVAYYREKHLLMENLLSYRRKRARKFSNSNDVNEAIERGEVGWSVLDREYDSSRGMLKPITRSHILAYPRGQVKGNIIEIIGKKATNAAVKEIKGVGEKVGKEVKNLKKDLVLAKGQIGKNLGNLGNKVGGERDGTDRKRKEKANSELILLDSESSEDSGDDLYDEEDEMDEDKGNKKDAGGGEETIERVFGKIILSLFPLEF